jgi:hypothetical protein
MKIAFDTLIEDFEDESGEFKKEYELLLSMVDLGKGTQRENWKNVDSYHMTQLFLGADRSKRSHPIYTSFVAG